MDTPAPGTVHSCLCATRGSIQGSLIQGSLVRQLGHLTSLLGPGDTGTMGVTGALRDMGVEGSWGLGHRNSKARGQRGAEGREMGARGSGGIGRIGGGGEETRGLYLPTGALHQHRAVSSPMQLHVLFAAAGEPSEAELALLWVDLHWVVRHGVLVRYSVALHGRSTQSKHTAGLQQKCRLAGEVRFVRKHPRTMCHSVIPLLSHMEHSRNELRPESY